MIVGNGAVGKSSMIQRFCKGTYTRDYKKTIGVDFLEREIEWVNCRRYWEMHSLVSTENYSTCAPFGLKIHRIPRLIVNWSFALFSHRRSRLISRSYRDFHEYFPLKWLSIDRHEVNRLVYYTPSWLFAPDDHTATCMYMSSNGGAWEKADFNRASASYRGILLVSPSYEHSDGQVCNVGQYKKREISSRCTPRASTSIAHSVRAPGGRIIRGQRPN